MRLFELAEENFKTHPDRAQRYTSLARLISMRYQVRLTREQKRRICKHCYRYLVPGCNCRIRLKNGTVLTTCMDCGRQSRYPYTDRISASENKNSEETETEEMFVE